MDKVVLRCRWMTADRGCGELDGYVSLINLSMLGDGDVCMFLRAPADGSLPVIGSDYVCDASTLPPR